MRELNLILFVIPFAVLIGCTTSRTSDTARTGIEQLLVSNAVDQTLDKMSLPPVEGRKVFLDAQFLDCVDKGYIVGSLRQRLLASGALLTDKKEGSEVTIEVCSGGVGTDNTDSFLGTPGIALPGPIPIQLPEVRVYQKKAHFGTAKISVVAYATADGRMMYDSGRSLARSNDSNWSIFGIGPFQSGTVLDEVRIANSQSASLPTRVARSSSESTTETR